MQPGILHRIEALHRRVVRLERLRLLSTFTMRSAALVAGAVTIDALVRWPMPVRCVLLAAGLVVAVRWMRRVIDGGWRSLPGAASLALRLERVEPSLAGTLASAFDFERTGEAGRNALAAAVVQQVRSQVADGRLERHVRRVRSVAMAGVALAVLAAWCVAIAQRPEPMLVGLRRTLTPWTSDQWPARVALQVNDLPKAVARGSTIEIAARVTRGDDADLRVRATCTVRGASLDERVFDLVRQPDGSFSRPVTAEGDRMTIELSAGDARCEAVEIVVRTPPAIARGEIDVQPPAYASSDRPALHAAWQGVAAGDPGLALAGSSARVQIELAADAADPTQGEPMVHLRAETGSPAPVVTATDARHWIIRFPVDAPVQLEVLPRDRQGVSAIEPLRLALRVGSDSEPTVSVAEPEADESVTTEASVPFRVEARDDIALASIGWRVDRQQRSGEPAPVVLGETRRESSKSEDRLQDSLSVAGLQARVGDVLQLRGLAVDRFERDGSRRTEVRSEPRRLRVIEREAFERQARQQAGTIREAAARLAAAQQDVQREQDAQAASRAQAGLAERVRDTTQSAQRLAQRLQRNGLREIVLSDTLREAAELGGQAEAQARQAQDALNRAGKGEQAARQQAQDAQRQAQASLQGMVDLLDRDDDAAGAQRRADRLAEAIARLRQDLKQAARSASGKDVQELSPPERQAMQEQSARQRATAEEAAAMIEDLRGRAERAQTQDRAQASSLRQAAEEGEKGQASRRLDEAAERTDRNQAAAADEAMQAAAEAVDRVRNTLREDRRARTEDLRRRLASLVETLQALVRQAEQAGRDIDALATQPERPTGEVTTQVSRLARNAAAAAEEAKQAGGTAQKAVGPIQRASGRFENSVVPLRAAPVNHEAARDDVSRGIDLLREGLQSVQQAQREQQARQMQQERDQLAKQYRQLAIDTRSVREVTAGSLPADGARLDRRGAATQREQAARMAGIERAFEQGPRKAEVLKGAAAFLALHERIARDLAAVRESLEAAQGGAGTVRQLDIVAGGFESLAQSLTDPEAPDDPFADATQQDGAGEGGGMGGGDEGKQALPPIAELRLVRQMQQQVNQLTGALDTARQAGQPVDRELQDLAAMQDEVRRLGQDWFDRMKEGLQKKRRAPADKSDAPAPPASMGLHFPWQGSAEAPAGAPAAPANGDAKAAPPRTLDELLGIGSGSNDTAADAQRKRKLERSLKEEDLSDLAKAATESMQVSSDMVRDRRDTGLGTQRVQADALASLDALIEAASRFQKQQQSSKSSSGQRQSGKPQQGTQQSSQQAGADEPRSQPQSGKGEAQGARRDPDGTSGDQVQPPEGGDEAAAGALLEGRSEWGRLPRRVREIMSQARRDPVSAMYQQATEAYYRRMAEDRKP